VQFIQAELIVTSLTPHRADSTVDAEVCPAICNTTNSQSVMGVESSLNKFGSVLITLAFAVIISCALSGVGLNSDETWWHDDKFVCWMAKLSQPLQT